MHLVMKTNGSHAAPIPTSIKDGKIIDQKKRQNNQRSFIGF